MPAFPPRGWSEILKRLAPYADTPLLTLGAKGAASVDDNGAGLFRKAAHVKGAHSAGAGDAFLAGFLHGRENGKSVAEALEAGNETAGMWMRGEI